MCHEGTCVFGAWPRQLYAGPFRGNAIIEFSIPLYVPRSSCFFASWLIFPFGQDYYHRRPGLRLPLFNTRWLTWTHLVNPISPTEWRIPIRRSAPARVAAHHSHIALHSLIIFQLLYFCYERRGEERRDLLYGCLYLCFWTLLFGLFR